MAFNAQSPDGKYVIGFSIWMTLYVLALFASITLIKTYHPAGLLLYVLAVLPALPVGGQITVFLAYLGRIDEYVRAILVKRFVVATGITLFLCTAWGFIEENAGGHHVSLYLVYALFWALFGLTSLIFRKAS